VSIVQAIALAGGFTDFADRDGIVVLRRGAQEGDYIPVSYTQLVDAPDKNEPLILRPGDTIIVR
jgi:polysaccharide export outer membrane protein